MVFGTKTYATGNRGYRVYKNELKGKKRFSCVILHFLVQSLVLVVLVVLLPPQAVVHTGKKVFSLEKQQQQPRNFSSFNFFLDFPGFFFKRIHNITQQYLPTTSLWYLQTTSFSLLLVNSNAFTRRREGKAHRGKAVLFLLSQQPKNTTQSTAEFLLLSYFFASPFYSVTLLCYYTVQNVPYTF